MNAGQRTRMLQTDAFASIQLQQTANVGEALSRTPLGVNGASSDPLAGFKGVASRR